MTLPKYGFAAAGPDEEIVHGACRPRHPTLAPPDDTVAAWLEFLREQGIERVCCLLDDAHLQEYEALLEEYRATFGADCVCHAPIPDESTIDGETLHETVLPFLRESDRRDQPVVVHCSAGLGRVGHVLVLWLAAERGYSIEDAVEVVRESGRIPLEATAVADLRQLLARTSRTGDDLGARNSANQSK